MHRVLSLLVDPPLSVELPHWTVTRQPYPRGPVQQVAPGCSKTACEAGPKYMVLASRGRRRRKPSLLLKWRARSSLAGGQPEKMNSAKSQRLFAVADHPSTLRGKACYVQVYAGLNLSSKMHPEIHKSADGDIRRMWSTSE